MGFSSIALAATSIYHLSEDLQKYARLNTGHELVFKIVQQLSRFRIWSENIGAHRSGRVSLDHRLRNASRAKDTVVGFLDDLNDSIQQVLEIITGSRSPYDEDDVNDEGVAESSEGEGEEETGFVPGTEMEMLLDDILHIVNLLYNFTIHICSVPRPRDHERKAAKINVSHFEPYDTKHIRQMFPGADEELLNRLGQANSRRRQIFKYLELHHWKISKPNDKPIQQERLSIPPNIEEEITFQTTEARESHAHLSSAGIISTTRETLNTQTTMTTIADEALQLEAGDSTSQVTSALSEGSGIERGPNLPDAPAEGLHGRAFQCPYCFEMIRVSSPRSWRIHVLYDLQPYICTFGHCPQSSLMISSRHEWFNHELDFHRGAAHDPSETLSNLPSDELSQLASVRELSGSEVIPHGSRFRSVPDAKYLKGKCPLCLREEVTLRSHVSRHLQVVATFSLPKILPHDIDDLASDQAVDWDSDAHSQSAEEDASVEENEAAKSADSEGTETSLAPFPQTSTITDTAQSVRSWLDTVATTGLIVKKVEEDLIHAVLQGDESRVRDILGAEKPTAGFGALSLAVNITAMDAAIEVVKALLTIPNINVNTEDKELKTPLIYAAIRGRSKIVELFLACSPIQPNLSDLCSRTPLWHACTEGHVDVVKKLIARDDVKVNLADYSGRAPLACASVHANDLIMRMLIERGADPLQEDLLGVDALSVAVTAGSVPAVDFLLSLANTDLNHSDMDGSTALIRAALKGHESIIVRLCKAGADGDARDKYGKTALLWWSQKGFKRSLQPIVDVLLSRMADIDAQDSKGRTALMSVVHTENLDVVEELLKRGADVNAQDIGGETALMLAVHVRNREVVKELLTEEADVNITDHDGKTALMVAVQQDSVELAKLLVDYGASLNIKDNSGGCALMQAVARASTDIIDFLLKHHANVHVTDTSGRTALHVAAGKNWPDAVLLLLRAGADPSAKDSKGQTVSQVAAEHGHEAVAKMLDEASSEVLGTL